MIIKLLIITFILFVILRTIGKYRNKDITFRESLIWILFWLIVAGATLMPQRTDVIANFLGVGRGADLLIYLSIIVLFFAVFKIIVRLEKIDRNFTEMVRHLALKEKNAAKDNFNKNAK